jgi:HSP20 family molecular chaperone IbpA
MIRSRLSATDLLFEPLLMSGLAGLDALHRDLGRRTEASRTARFEAGAVNIGMDGDDIDVVCVAPGMKPDDFDVSVHGKRLEIRGKRLKTENAANVRPQKTERWAGEFHRVVELPFDVDSDEVDAVYSKGLLRLKLVRKANPKRTIEIKQEA